MTLKLKGIASVPESESENAEGRDNGLLQLEADKQAMKDGSLSPMAFKDHLNRLRYGVYPQHM